MVNEQEQDSGRRPANQGVRDVIPEPNKINASTAYDFNGKNLTPYGGLLPVITMLERLGFQALVAQTLTSKRIPRAMDVYRFVLGIVLGLYIGFPRLNQLRFIARDPILTGILLRPALRAGALLCICFGLGKYTQNDIATTAADFLFALIICLGLYFMSVCDAQAKARARQVEA